MGASTPTKILLKGDARFEEGTAGGTITPGHLIMLNSSGQYVVHNNVQGPAEACFAAEDALQGNPISTDYSSTNKVNVCLPYKGTEVYAWLAGGEKADVGDFLTSNGDGNLQVLDLSDAGQFAVAVAVEAVDQSESDEVDSRIKVRVL